MSLRWTNLNTQEHATFRATVAFLDKRLQEQGTIDWALKLKPTQLIEQFAIDHILQSASGGGLGEPWATAWCLIEESWLSSAPEAPSSTLIYGIQKRLAAGDHSGAIIAAIVGFVAPRLKVEPLDSWRRQFTKKRRKPKTFGDLLSASLTSGDLIDLHVLKLESLTDVAFLMALASALEAAVNHGLDIVRRFGWQEQRSLMGLNLPNRVYSTIAADGNDEETELDAYSHGITPSIKLLFAVVERIVELDVRSAQIFIQRWRVSTSPVYVRLFAAISRSNKNATAAEVGEFLLRLDEREFWNLHVFPEIAELRAMRFNELDEETKSAVTKRLRKGPPRDHWPKKADKEDVKKARLYWAVRELRRIEIAGGVLSRDSKSWVDGQVRQFSDLEAMTAELGFPEGVTGGWVQPNPDHRYDAVAGVARLRMLETAFSAIRRGWDDNPAERANDWLRQPGKPELILVDLETSENGGDAFPHLWNRFGWAHSPIRPENAADLQPDLQSEADRVLVLLTQLSEATLTASIMGISAWLDSWKRQVVASRLGLRIWLWVWRIAVEATNAEPEKEDDTDLSVTARVMDKDQEPMDLDTLNSPAGKLVGVFLSACPDLGKEPDAFAIGGPTRQMLDAVITSTGRSGLIARHRLIEHLPYFLHADQLWAKENLIAPLLREDSASLALWRAIARRPRSKDVLEIIGGAMAERATDQRLGRSTRESLVFSLIIESLHALREKQKPAVPYQRIQQMLRTIDDEVRAFSANAITRFVRDLSRSRNNAEVTSPAELFRSAAAPFLHDVWPQERSLATPGVSRALSNLPATSGEAFAEAVDSIVRFLVPFDCWSMVDYGLFGEDGHQKKLAIIDDELKANALLRLFDLTIGNSEGAVMPYDLTDALDQIRRVSPPLAESAIFRRLSTMARR